jgi:hypothetical protein
VAAPHATDPTRARCYNHALREAAARCPACGRTYCRECVTEHEGRLLCAACLGAPPEKRANLWRRARAAGTLLAALLSVALLWLCVFAAGLGLLALPASFHEGTLGVPTVQEPGP